MRSDYGNGGEIAPQDSACLHIQRDPLRFVNDVAFRDHGPQLQYERAAAHLEFPVVSGGCLEFADVLIVAYPREGARVDRYLANGCREQRRDEPCPYRDEVLAAITAGTFRDRRQSPVGDLRLLAAQLVKPSTVPDLFFVTVKTQRESIGTRPIQTMRALYEAGRWHDDYPPIVPSDALLPPHDSATWVLATSFQPSEGERNTYHEKTIVWVQLQEPKEPNDQNAPTADAPAPHDHADPLTGGYSSYVAPDDPDDLDAWAVAVASEQPRHRVRNWIPEGDLYGPRWQEFTKVVRKAWNYRCGLCGCTDAPTEVHHNDYAHAGDERFFDVIPLCAECHERHHEVVSRVEREVQRIIDGVRQSSKRKIDA